MLSAGIYRCGLSKFHPCFWFHVLGYILKSYFDSVLSCISDITGTELTVLTLCTVVSSSKITLPLNSSLNCLLWFIRSLPLFKFFTYSYSFPYSLMGSLTPHISRLCYREWEKGGVRECERESVRVKDPWHLCVSCYLYSESASVSLVIFTVLQFAIKLASGVMFYRYPNQEIHRLKAKKN